MISLALTLALTVQAAAVDRLVESYRVAAGVPGIAVAVARNGTIVKAKGYGLARRRVPLANRWDDG